MCAILCAIPRSVLGVQEDLIHPGGMGRNPFGQDAPCDTGVPDPGKHRHGALGGPRLDGELEGDRFRFDLARLEWHGRGSGDFGFSIRPTARPGWSISPRPEPSWDRQRIQSPRPSCGGASPPGAPRPQKRPRPGCCRKGRARAHGEEADQVLPARIPSLPDLLLRDVVTARGQPGPRTTLARAPRKEQSP